MTTLLPSVRRRVVPDRASIAAAVVAALLAASTAAANPGPSSPVRGALKPSAATWLSLPDAGAAPREAGVDTAGLQRIAVRAPSVADAEDLRWWSTGGPAYRWNEIVLAELREAFVTLPLAARHLALLQAALDDAMATARGAGSAPKAGRPSEHAAAAAAAADVLAYLFPARATSFAERADAAIRVRLVTGTENAADLAAGQAIGKRVAAAAIARGMSDGSGGAWDGKRPEGPAAWKGTPIAPMAGTWRTWVLSSPAEFRPPPPPAIDSEKTRAAVAELKAVTRSPKIAHRALYWEVHGGARAHVLWNEIARTKLVENDVGGPMAARVLAALNVAFIDAGIACWDAKYTYWLLRPTQLDGNLKSQFPAPAHPSYPAAHGCLSTAAATVLAAAFPRDREALLALGREAAEARVWAGIHYRFDIEAGEEIGRKVADKVVARAFAQP